MALTPRERLYLQNAIEQISTAEAAAKALDYSYSHLPEWRENGDYNNAQWERWDALTVRFARLSDILTHPVFRAIDQVEFLPSGGSF